MIGVTVVIVVFIISVTAVIITQNSTENNTTTNNTTVNATNNTTRNATQNNTTSNSTSTSTKSSSSSDDSDEYHYSAQYDDYIKYWRDSDGNYHLRGRDGVLREDYNTHTGEFIGYSKEFGYEHYYMKSGG